jgi:hypothetical protein
LDREVTLGDGAGNIYYFESVGDDRL